MKLHQIKLRGIDAVEVGKVRAEVILILLSDVNLVQLL